MKHQQQTLSRYLVHYFQEFYFEVIRLKERVIEAQDFDTQVTDEQSPQEVLALSMQKKLKTILQEQQIRVSNHAGDYALKSYQEALYIMAALADEVFLSLDWFGKKTWKENLLENYFFQTQLAGEQFFTRLDDILSHPDALKKEIATLYLMALGLGFKGRYSSPNDLDILSTYQSRLYHLIEGHAPNLNDQDDSIRLIPECYEHTLQNQVLGKIPDVRRWAYVFLGVLGIYLFVSYVVWYKLVQGMEETVHYILNQSKVMVPA